MNGRVLVCCASRDRPLSIGAMIDSVFSTSLAADVAVYIDADQQWSYTEGLESAKVTIGERIGPVASLNELVRLNPGYEAYGAATDDCQFVSPSWDGWVLKQAREHPISVIAPYTLPMSGTGGERMDFPWATAGWIEALGHLAEPSCYHSYWDVTLELLGEATCIRRASEADFAIRHDELPTNSPHIGADAKSAILWVACFRHAQTAKMQKAMEKARSRETTHGSSHEGVAG